MKLYKFYKPGCSPCGTLKKIMRQMDLSEFEIIEIDMSLDENLDAYPEIEIVPVLRFENGNELIGVRSKVNLENWIMENK